MPAFTAALCFLAALALPALAQKKEPPAARPSTYEVARGDTLFRIAGRTRPPGVALNQMVLALYRANPDAFLDGNINQLVVGRILSIPGRDAILAVDPGRAAQELKALIARPVVVPAPIPAPVQPPPPAAKEPLVSPKPRAERARPPASLSPAQAAERFQKGQQAEQNGDLTAAMAAYLAAGESGYGPAQKRLGDIYNTGNAVVQRDYETALRWYQKAREQGIEIPRPLTHAPVRPN